MIAYLKGNVIQSGAGFLILETMGVGYKVYIKSKAESRKPKLIELFIHEHLREDTNDLYGFESYQELELFEQLISVNGVGPKAGLAIMSSAPAERITNSIINEDLSFFKSISGIGNKVAAKIILDLKSKLSDADGLAVISRSGQPDDVVDALTSLGYKRAEINQALTKIPIDLKSAEEKIRWCLKNLTRG